MTAAGPAAVAALDKTIMSYLAIGRETGPLLKAAFEADPDMVMAHCLKGYFLLLMGSGTLKARVPKSVAAAGRPAWPRRRRARRPTWRR